MSIIEHKRKVLEYYLRAYDEKLMAGTSGNISIFDRETNQMIITPSCVDSVGMTEEDIIVTTLSGEVLEGSHKPSSEWRLHAQIYQNMEQVCAIVHTHSPYATAFAVTHDPVPTILIEMIPFLGGNVPVSKFAFPGTEQVGTNAVEQLRDRNACLMENHGVVAVGGTMEQAYVRAVYVEDAAKIYHMAACVGKPVSISAEDEARMKGR